MRAMILAAGRGERMGQLTADTPKPLLKAGGQYLIEYAIQQLAAAGVSDIVINVSYLGNKIKNTIGNGSRYGVHIAYSEEEQRLETGGGIVKALPLLGDKPFIVLSSDVVTDFPLTSLPVQPAGLAHLVLVDNPEFHSQGDFGLRDKYVDMDVKPAYTFANVAVYRPEFFAGCKPEYFPLNQLLFPAIKNQQITGEYYQGRWHNIGTSEQLEAFAAFE